MMAQYLLEKGNKIFLWQRSALFQRHLSCDKQMGTLDNSRTWPGTGTEGHPHVLGGADVSWAVEEKEAEGRLSAG